LRFLRRQPPYCRSSLRRLQPLRQAPRQNIPARNQRRNWQRAYVEYTDCLKKFINDQQALAEPHVKASNDAINEYNNGVKEYNSQIEKAKGN